MVERVRLRHQEAEALISKAKQQAIEREQQLQLSRSRGQIQPPEVSLLGCWQTIEQSAVSTLGPNTIADSKLGDLRTFFTTLTPDNYLFGESISQGSLILSGPHAGKVWPGLSTYDVTGRIISTGKLRYRLLPATGTEFIGKIENSDFGTGLYKMLRLPELVEAQWEGWELEGKFYNDQIGQIGDFKAVRIGD